TVTPTATGPLRAAFEVVRAYRWPRGLDADGPGAASRGAGDARSAELVEVPVTTTVELRAGEPFVRLRVAFDNPCVQHRVRLHVPLSGRAEVSAAEGQFAVVERGLRAEGGRGEVPLPTFPARGFVAAGGAAVLLEHVTEYELVGDGTELAITLLRSVGLISRNTNPYRVEPAGPEVEIPGAQGIGPVVAAMAVLPYQGSWDAAGVAAQAERYRHDLVAAEGRGPEGSLEAISGLRIDGDRGTVLSSLRRRGGWLELRVVREHPDPGHATITGPFTRARACDLLGQEGSPLPVSAGTLHLDLDPWEIRTLHLRFR
ncbi:MAG TPA: alpha-mannosidase, partial [Actinomycetota bacterium]|nr:alpha-mannosidase [Actinomycetota bacterium]